MTPVNRLTVIIAGQIAGEVTRSENGRINFKYTDDYSGTPLSVSMPISNRLYSDKIVRPYVYGLLPDDKTMRANIARQFEVRASNPLDLLSCIGLDCPGAVQFCEAGALEQALGRPGQLVPVDDAAIANRLRNLRVAEEGSWIGREERWSLGGNQGKFALCRQATFGVNAEGPQPQRTFSKMGWPATVSKRSTNTSACVWPMPAVCLAQMSITGCLKTNRRLS